MIFSPKSPCGRTRRNASASTYANQFSIAPPTSGPQYTSPTFSPTPMISPPTTAPGTKVKPPRIRTGSALSATSDRLNCTPLLAPHMIPATIATIPATDQTISQIVLSGMPIEGAADAGALEEDPEDRDEDSRRQRGEHLEPVDLDPGDDERAVGDADVELLDVGAPDYLAEALEEEGQPDRRHEQDDVLLVDERAEHEALDDPGERDHHGGRPQERRDDGHAPLQQADQRERREQDHRTLGEIEHPRGLEDEHEAERHERVHEPGEDAAREHLHEEGRRAHHVLERSDGDPVEELSHGSPRGRRRGPPGPSGPARAGRRRSCARSRGPPRGRRCP